MWTQRGENRYNLIKKLEQPTTKLKAEVENESVITLVVPYFQEIKDLKQLLTELQEDINMLTGEQTSIIVSARKGQSISNLVVKNNKLCESTVENPHDQKCGAKNCLSCQLMVSRGEPFTINGRTAKPLLGTDCKSRNVIYVAQCTLCESINTYGGQTVQPLHKRINGHRSCFNINDSDVIEKSALALHAAQKHSDNFNLENFKFLIYKQVNPRSLNRHESVAIGTLRTGVLGLNRMNIQKI